MAQKAARQTKKEKEQLMDMWPDKDPWDLLLEMNDLLNRLTENHNNLVQDYTITQKRIRRLELQMEELRRRHLL